jgi:hypothetical protein
LLAKTGKGNYTGRAVGFFDILPRQIAVEWIEDSPADLDGGKAFSVYTIKGEKYYSGTAQTDVFRLDKIPEGVYILYHNGQYSKFSY